MKFRIYRSLYEKNLNFYQKRPTAKKVLLFINKYLTLFFFGAYVGVWIYSLFTQKSIARDLVGLFFIPSASLCLVSALRFVIAKPRPYDIDGASITPLIDKPTGKYSSSPSRHITSAVAIALGVFQISPAISVCLLVASFVLAYTRFAVGVHYITDLILGAAIPVVVTAGYYFLLTFL